MRCDASWRGGESCFSPVCCSLSSYGRRRRCVCPPPSLPPLICCLFCFLSVLSPKRFGKVQISALTAQCSKRKGKNKRVAGAGGRDGGGEEAQALALARPEHGDWCPGAGLALRTLHLRAWWSLSPGSPLPTSAPCHSAGCCWREDWKSKVSSSSSTVWAGNPRGSQLFVRGPEM